jgi:hypothetical protein
LTIGWIVSMGRLPRNSKQGNDMVNQIGEHEWRYCRVWIERRRMCEFLRRFCRLEAVSVLLWMFYDDIGRKILTDGNGDDARLSRSHRVFIHYLD